MIIIYLITMYIIGIVITIRDRRNLNEYNGKESFKENFSNLRWDMLQIICSPLVITLIISDIIYEKSK